MNIASCDCDTNSFLVFVDTMHLEHYLSKQHNTDIKKIQSKVILTPASPPIGLPSRSNSASISSIVLLIMATILGILALITASKCWMKKMEVHQQLVHAIQIVRAKYITTAKCPHMRQKLSKILCTHFMCQVTIIGTTFKVLLFFSSCCEHVNIFVDISL